MEKGKNSVTSYEDLLMYSKGAVVELSPFSDSFPFVCRLKRPSLLDIISNGSIPNELLPVAVDLFQAKDEEEENGGSAEQIIERSVGRNKIFIEIAKSSLVEPTYEEIKKAGLDLTPEQLLDIYYYVNSGVEKLKFFRENE